MIRPCGHRLIVVLDKVEERTGGGLYLADTTRDRKMNQQIFGTIVSIGPNCWKAFDDGRAWAKEGDKVAIAQYAGFEIEDPWTKQKYRLIQDEDVCAVIEPESIQ